MPSLQQSDKTLEQLSQRHLKFAELLAQGEHSKADCIRLAGFAESMGRSASAYISTTREKSKYPALWDYYQKLRNRRLRLFDVSAESIKDELKVIAFSKITNYVSLPKTRDLQRQKLFDAKIRKGMGYTDAEDEKILALEDELRESIGGENRDDLRKFSPGASVKLKALDDIPDELIPAIQSIEETRDGIKIKLYNKLDALDKLARIAKLYDDPDDASKATVIENLNVIVNGTKSDLLKDIDKI